MKLYKNKKVVALLTTFTLITVPVVSKAIDNNLDAYYDDTNINIENKLWKLMLIKLLIYN